MHFTLPKRPALHLSLLLGAAAIALSGCDSNGTFDFDLRNFGGSGVDTSDAVRQAINSRPEPDARGVISYPSYQVVVAKRGDSVAVLADRVGVSASELASYNALDMTTVLTGGEVLVLPGRAGSAASGGVIDITSLASGAIDRATGTDSATNTTAAPAATATPTTTASGAAEPIRHKVARGETAYSIARYYDVSVRALADWNGLPTDLGVREGQYLLIPTATQDAPRATAAITPPGAGSPTPTPPSAARPLPATTPPAASAPVATPPAPDLGASRTAASASARMQMPVAGAVIRPYVAKKNDGIDIAAAAGTPVKAAAAGIVAAITKDTEGVQILVIRHENNLLTVYDNIDSISVAKGDSVSRGQTVAKVRAGDSGFLHFEVRDGFDSVDPMPYLQ
jgi:murein DD-endopeptidase MepM/ murein hydrolase activator NlpD